MSDRLCTIQPENVAMVRVFGMGMLAASAIALATGKAYCRGPILREEQPLTYWMTVASTSVLGVMCVLGSFVC